MKRRRLLTHQRASDLQASMLARIDEFEADLTEFVEGQGWLALGHPSLREWWDTVIGERRLGPAARKLVLVQMHTEQQELPGSWREHNGRLGARVGVSDETVSRSLRATDVGNDDQGEPMELDVTDRAIELARDGVSYRQMGQILKIDESSLRRSPEVRAAREQADPDAHSVRHYDRTAACDIEPATEVIEKIHVWLDRLLGPVYTLSPKDAETIRDILAAALKELDNQ